MRSVDSYLDRRFHIRRYNCWHFTREVWLDFTGQDLGDLTPEEISGAALAQKVSQEVSETAGGFIRIEAPTDPCLVLMRRERDVPHIGVYTRGKVLQITAAGVTFLPVERARAGYQSVRFYRVADRYHQGPARP